MQQPRPSARRLAAHDVADVVDVLCDAFADYPVMRFVLGPGGNTRLRMARMVHLFVSRRVRLGGPMLGVGDDAGRLVGAAVMTLPIEPDPPADILALREETWKVLGQDALDRHEAYGTVARTLSVPEPHHHLNMIGVRHAEHGKGLARPLLEAAFDLAVHDPTSAGLSLTTETPANVRLYQHFGFDVVGHGRVSPELETWGLFKKKS